MNHKYLLQIAYHHYENDELEFQELDNLIYNIKDLFNDKEVISLNIIKIEGEQNVFCGIRFSANQNPVFCFDAELSRSASDGFCHGPCRVSGSHFPKW